MTETIIKAVPELLYWALRCAVVLIIAAVLIIAGLIATNRKGKGK